jgi:hypothetical protein
MEPRTLRPIVAVVIVLLIIVVFWTRPGPECPNHSSYPLAFADGTYDTLPLAGPITAIPEFHDCQRLLEQDGASYGPLAGIWVAQDLAERGGKLGTITVNTPSGGGGMVSPGMPFDSSPSLTPPAAAGELPTSARSFALVYSWDGRYDPLGIKSSWNCLYVYAAGGGALKASMVSVKKPEQCQEPVPIAALAELESGSSPVATPLDVTAFRDPELDPDDYPSVGRWDWDPSRNQQYIGLRCGDAWCEVTAQAQGSERQSSPAYDASDMNPAGPPVFSVKGWYDEQRLAVTRFWGRAKPTSVMGTVVPDQHLGDLTEGSFTDTWQPVGQVGLSDNLDRYAKDYGFIKAAMPKGASSAPLAKVAICHGDGCFPDDGYSAPSCGWKDAPEKWWSRVTSPGEKPHYRCIKRVDHSSTADKFPIPATARWWWVARDEKTWFRCGTACCTMN